MLNGFKIVVIMPAYNAEKTLEKTYNEIPKDIVDKVILVDDFSHDNTVGIAKKLGIETYQHEKNYGYGGNQKTCYKKALELDSDIIVMLHPDYQYDPRVIPFAVGFVVLGICDIVLGCRIRTRYETLKAGMPFYKYVSNRLLTVLENVILGQNLGDFHSGFRVYRREVFEKIYFYQNSNGFVFDTEFIVQAVFCGFRIGDIPIPTRYFDEASSIDFRNSLKYGIQTVWVMIKYLLQKTKLFNFKIFKSIYTNKNK